jgi:quinol-cytochrome oxidoreductase complex cytochrome b subunit
VPEKDLAVRAVLRWTLIALAITFALLLTSGLWLVWNYRPTDGLTFVPNAYAGPSIAWTHRITIWHRWTSAVAVGLAIAVLVEVVIGAVLTRRWRAVVAAAGAPVLAAVAAVSGYLIAWDQLGLEEVTVGKNMMGYDAVFDAKLTFVAIGSQRVSPGTYHRWYWVHVAVVPGVVLALSLAIVVLSRRRPAAIACPPEPDVDVIRE